MAGAAGCWCLGLQCNDLSSLGHQAKLCNIIYYYASVESLQYTSDIIILLCVRSSSLVRPAALCISRVPSHHVHSDCAEMRTFANIWHCVHNNFAS